MSMRPIFVIMTTLPTCMMEKKRTDGEQDPHEQDLYSKFFLSSHDLMFSGHTCLFMFFGNIIGGYPGYFIQYLLPISLVMSKQHYSIDVLTSFFVYNYFNLLLI